MKKTFICAISAMLMLLLGTIGIASAYGVIDYYGSGSIEGKTYQSFSDSNSSDPVITWNRDSFDLPANILTSGQLTFHIWHLHNAAKSNADTWELQFYANGSNLTDTKILSASPTTSSWVHDSWTFNLTGGNWSFKLIETTNGADLIYLDKAAVPLPAAAWLLGTGLIGLVAIRRVRK